MLVAIALSIPPARPLLPRPVSAESEIHPRRHRAPKIFPGFLNRFSFGMDLLRFANTFAQYSMPFRSTFDFLAAKS